MDEIKMSMQGGVFLTLALAALLGSAWVVKTRLDNGQKVWKLVTLSAAPVALCVALVFAGTHNLAITLMAIVGLCALVGAFLGVALSQQRRVRDIPVLGSIFGVTALVIGGVARMSVSPTDRREESKSFTQSETPKTDIFPIGFTAKRWTVTGNYTTTNWDDD